MGTMGKLGTIVRLGGLVTLAAIGLFCSGGAGTTPSRAFSADMVEPIPDATSVPLDQVIVIQCSYPLESVEDGCVIVFRAPDDQTITTLTTWHSDHASRISVVPDFLEEDTTYRVTLDTTKIVVAPGGPAPTEQPETWTFHTVAGQVPTEEPPLGDPGLVEGANGYAESLALAGDDGGTGVAVFSYGELDSQSPTFWHHVYTASIASCQLGTPHSPALRCRETGAPPRSP